MRDSRRGDVPLDPLVLDIRLQHHSLEDEYTKRWNLASAAEAQDRSERAFDRMPKGGNGDPDGREDGADRVWAD